MAVAAFVRPKAGSPPSCHLYVANLGPAVGVSVTEASAIFSTFGTVTDIQEAGDCGNRLYISFADREAAQNAKAALHQRPCPAAGGRVIIIQFAELKVTAPTGPPPLEVNFSGQEVGIPGLVYVPEYVSEEVERELLAEVDGGNWHRLAKRRVQHYGFEFQYKSRNVDPEQEMGTFPPAFRAVSESIERLLKSLAEASAELSGSALGDSAGQFPSNPQLEGNLQTTGRNGLATERFWPLDQLTVNEYPAGVGLSPHVDTHSAFQGAIVSLSLAGPAVMEFRRECQDTEPGLCLPKIDTNDGAHDGQLERRCLFLAPRSLLVLTGEARYAWQHYIPHRKGDVVAGVLTPRGERRVSLTFRKVRTGPCGCEYPECCDSQQGVREGGPKRVREGGWLRMEGARESREPEVGPSTVIPITTVHRSLEDGGSQDPQVKVDPKTAGYKPQIDPSHGLTPEDSLSPGALRDGSPSASSSSPFVVPEIEKRHVHQVYDAIAMHFSATRFAKWPKVAQFLEGLPGGSLVVDAGCGNGGLQF
jgi:alkylated DNA repair protein alkB family protein 8